MCCGEHASKLLTGMWMCMPLCSTARGDRGGDFVGVLVMSAGAAKLDLSFSSSLGLDNIEQTSWVVPWGRNIARQFWGVARGLQRT